MKHLLTYIFVFSTFVSWGQNDTTYKKQKLYIIDSLEINSIVSLSSPVSLSQVELDSLNFIIKTINPHFSILKEHNYKLLLNDNDTAYFILKNELSNINPYIKLNDSVIYKFPNFLNNILMLQKVWSVTFDDINSDNYTDIIIVGEFFTGTGPIQARYYPYYIFNIYFGSQKGFITEDKLYYKINMERNKLMSFDEIKKDYLNYLNSIDKVK